MKSRSPSTKLRSCEARFEYISAFDAVSCFASWKVIRRLSRLCRLWYNGLTAKGAKNSQRSAKLVYPLRLFASIFAFFAVKIFLLCAFNRRPYANHHRLRNRRITLLSHAANGNQHISFRKISGGAMTRDAVGHYDEIAGHALFAFKMAR